MSAGCLHGGSLEIKADHCRAKSRVAGDYGFMCNLGLGASTARVIQTGGPISLGGTVTLAWDTSPDAAVSGYRLYQGLASRNYSMVYNVGDTTNFTVAGLQLGTAYFFAMTGYDTNGLESDFSAELVYTNGSGLNSSLQITDMARSADGNFIISGTGVAGQNCVLMAATNLAPPVTWTPIATNRIRVPGAVTFIDLHATNYPSRFYRLWQTGPALVPATIAATGKSSALAAGLTSRLQTKIECWCGACFSGAAWYHLRCEAAYPIRRR